MLKEGKVSEKTVGRLSLYRRVLEKFDATGKDFAFSHDIATYTGASSDQVRRDIMVLGYSGSPNRGYSVPQLLRSITDFLDSMDLEKVVLIGVGNLGRAILSFFTGKRPNLSIIACFDNDQTKIGRVINGCRCYHTDEIYKKIPEIGATIAIIAVPAMAAQDIAEKLNISGIRGILNFAPTTLKVSSGIYVEDIDMTMSLEKVAYYSKQHHHHGAGKERRLHGDKAGN